MRSRIERLNELKEKMQEAARNRDKEEAHGVADDLLCEVVSALAGKAEHDIVQAILTAYGEVGKFYA